MPTPTPGLERSLRRPISVGWPGIGPDCSQAGASPSVTGSPSVRSRDWLDSPSSTSQRGETECAEKQNGLTEPAANRQVRTIEAACECRATARDDGLTAAR